MLTIILIAVAVILVGPMVLMASLQLLGDFFYKHSDKGERK